MTFAKATSVLAMGSILVMGACTNPAYLDPDDPHSKAKQGALIGGLLGAGIGALTSDDDKGATIAGSAILGAAAGGLIGNELDKQAAELRQELDDGISVVNEGDRLVVSLPNDLTFDTDSYAVRPVLKTDLSKVAANLQRYPNSTVQVIGHTDSDGEASYNLTLSQRRANAVADELQAGGVSYTRIRTSGRGEDEPVASNLDEAGKARNRRVEIVVIPSQS
ncbi:OmpA family protein [Aliisedimentitalea scapharcae]|uniref:OmpA family protein n=1 Tax=Aliisedimentitalea scapharcae TaxID=1524259 RepID=A0ABZ2XUD9_9RHOB|nr:OmpA family protein [Rhodobacteraceae bacterium M382]